MGGTLSKRCYRRTGRQTEISVLRAAWSQLKTKDSIEYVAFPFHIANLKRKIGITDHIPEFLFFRL